MQPFDREYVCTAAGEPPKVTYPVIWPPGAVLQIDGNQQHRPGVWSTKNYRYRTIVLTDTQRRV
jgi:hypothetical protein